MTLSALAESDFVAWFNYSNFPLFFSFLATVCGLQELSSPTWDGTWAPAMKALCSNQWVTREVPKVTFLIQCDRHIIYHARNDAKHLTYNYLILVTNLKNNNDLCLDKSWHLHHIISITGLNDCYILLLTISYILQITLSISFHILPSSIAQSSFSGRKDLRDPYTFIHSRVFLPIRLKDSKGQSSRA